MLGQYWYHGLVRKYVAVFGTLFNDIYVKMKNSSDDVIETIKIPLAYGPKQKFMARISGDENLDKKVGMQLPRMGFDDVLQGGFSGGRIKGAHPFLWSTVPDSTRFDCPDPSQRSFARF